MMASCGCIEFFARKDLPGGKYKTNNALLPGKKGVALCFIKYTGVTRCGRLEVGIVRTNGQHRALGALDDLFSHGAEQNQVKTLAAAGTHDDQIRLLDF